MDLNGLYQWLFSEHTKTEAVYLGPWQNQFARTFLEHAPFQFSLQSRHLQNDLFEKWRRTLTNRRMLRSPMLWYRNDPYVTCLDAKNCYVKNLLGKCYILLDFWKQSWTGISSNTNNGKFACGHQLRLFCYANALEPLTLGERSSRWWKGSLTGSDGYETHFGSLEPTW